MSRVSPAMPEKLADCAFRLFARRGIDQVTLDAVAAEAGVTKGSLYWHYKSKDEIIRAACGHYYCTFHKRIHSAAAGIADPVERLEKVLTLSVKTCLMDEENRVFTSEIFRLSFQEKEIRQGWQQFYASVREMYIGLVLAAAQTGGIVVNDAEGAVNLMLETMEGVKLRALFEPHICSLVEERKILEGLKQILGFPNLKAKAA